MVSLQLNEDGRSLNLASNRFPDCNIDDGKKRCIRMGTVEGKKPKGILNT